MKRKLYIAYGSNINSEQMAQRCPDARVVGTAMLPAYALEFRRVATIVTKPDAQVPVLLWEISQRDEKSLNLYEGFPKLYRKEKLEVELDGRPVTGMAYVMNYGSPMPPSMTYYECIRRGYRENSLDSRYLEQALENALGVGCGGFERVAENGFGMDEGVEEPDAFQMELE
jgi:hypothetical protein